MKAENQNLVLLVDDDADVRAATAQTLMLAGFDVVEFSSAKIALRYISRSFEGLIVCDIRMPQIDGHEFYRRVRAIDDEIPFIFITGHGDIQEAVDAMRQGAYDFLAKPFLPERLVESVARAMTARVVALEHRMLREAMHDDDAASAILGESAVMGALRERVRQVARADIDVLVEGETGSGKGLIANALHAGGSRRKRPFVAINCAALAEATIAIDLCGAESGAVQGAYRRRPGRIESAEGGTVLLDDIDLAPLSVQHFLLPIIANKAVTPVGADEPRPVDFRIVATSKRDLAALAGAGAFRQDLYYRMSVVLLKAPPLRDRRDDIPGLFARFLQDASTQFVRPAPRLSDAVRRKLLEGDWPGNVRELRNFAERVVLGFEPGDATGAAAGPASLPERIERFESSLLRDALEATSGDVRAAIKLLGIPRKTFYDKIVRHAIDLGEFRTRGSP